MLKNQRSEEMIVRCVRREGVSLCRCYCGVVNLLRTRYEPIVGGFFEPIRTLPETKLFTYAGWDEIVSGTKKIDAQGILGSKRGTQRETMGLPLVYLVAIGAAVESRFRRENLKGTLARAT
jgi:hypothetical protein